MARADAAGLQSATAVALRSRAGVGWLAGPLSRGWGGRAAASRRGAWVGPSYREPAGDLPPGLLQEDRGHLHH